MKLLLNDPQELDQSIDQFRDASSMGGVVGIKTKEFAAPYRHLRSPMGARHRSTIDESMNLLGGECTSMPPREPGQVRHRSCGARRQGPIAVALETVATRTKLPIEFRARRLRQLACPANGEQGQTQCADRKTCNTKRAVRVSHDDILTPAATLQASASRALLDWSIRQFTRRRYRGMTPLARYHPRLGRYLRR